MFRALDDAGLIAYGGGGKTLLRRPRRADRFPEGETRPPHEIVEKRFMKYILDGDCRPGQQINGLDLARQFGVSTSAIRDYVSRFSQFGLLEKRLNGGRMFKGFAGDFAEELFEVRRMFEMRAAERFLALPRSDPVWAKLDSIRREHLALLDAAHTRYADFSELDERFSSPHQRRLAQSFHRWNLRYNIVDFPLPPSVEKRDEQERNIVAIREHRAYIDALQSGRRTDVATAVKAHMATARRTLAAAIENFERATCAADPSVRVRHASTLTLERF